VITVLNYFVVAAIFGALGLWFYAVCRWWFLHLTGLAERHNVELRRKLATRHFLFMPFVLGIPIVVVVLGVVQFFPISVLFLPAVLLPAILPSIIWWFRHWPSLKALGYGRRQEHHA
jgi:hypothetical protein